MANVQLSAQFRQDVRTIVARLAEVAGGKVADEYAAAIQRSVGQLASTPGIGAPRGKLGRNVRMLVVAPYLIFYEGTPKAKAVTVLRMFHGRRRITRGMVARGREDEIG